MADGLQRLGPVVLGDPVLFRSLARLTDLDDVKRALATVAATHDIALTPGEVDEALVAARRRWFERLI